MSKTTLRVAAVTIRDVLGISEAKVEPGKVTVISGRNGSQKTSFLHAVQAALGGGSLAKLQRIGAEGEEVEAEVVLRLDGPGHERYLVERNGDKVRVRKRVGDTAAFEDVQKPQAFLGSLYDAQGANPVRFLTAADKDRALMLLEALPLKFDRAELLTEMGIAGEPLPPIPTGLHPLEEIGMIRVAVFDRRTAVNVDGKSATTTADQLRRKIPAELPEDPAAEVKALEAAVTKLAADLAAGEEKAGAAEREAIAKAETDANAKDAEIDATFQVFARDQRAAHEKRVSEWEADFRKRVAADLAEVNARIEERKTADSARLGEIEADEAAARRKAGAARVEAEAALTALRNTVTAKRQQLAVLREQDKTAALARELDAQAAGYEKDAERLKSESERLTEALDALDAYRRRMAEELPIPGLSIEGKVIKVNGVPFDQLNMQTRIDIAVQVAVLRARGAKLPLLFVDGAEALDKEHFGELAARLGKEEIQAFIARVDDTDLTVTKDAVLA